MKTDRLKEWERQQQRELIVNEMLGHTPPLAKRTERIQTSMKVKTEMTEALFKRKGEKAQLLNNISKNLVALAR